MARQDHGGVGEGGVQAESAVAEVEGGKGLGSTDFWKPSGLCAIRGIRRCWHSRAWALIAGSPCSVSIHLGVLDSSGTVSGHRIDPELEERRKRRDSYRDQHHRAARLIHLLIGPAVEINLDSLTLHFPTELEGEDTPTEEYAEED